MKDIKKKILIIIAVTVIFYAFIGNSFAIHREFEVINELAEQEKRPVDEAVEVPVVEYRAEGLRNPFEGFRAKVVEPGEAEENLVEEVVTLPTFTIQGIVFGPRFPQVIIDNKVLKIGDTIQEARIVDINKESIILLYKDEKFTLMSPSAKTLGDLEKQSIKNDSEVNPEGGKDESSP